MKIKWYLLAFILGSIVFNSCDPDELQECIPANLRKSVIAYYPLTNGSLNEQLKNKNTLTNFNAQVTEDRFGNPDCAYQFDRTADTYLVGNGKFTDNFHKKPYSVSLWFKATGYRHPAEWESLVSRFKAPDYWTHFWSLYLHDARLPFTGINEIVVTDKTPNEIKSENRHEFYSNRWIHLVATFDGKELKLYRDGNLGEKNYYFSRPKTKINEGELYIGNNYTGSIDDIIFFNKALSEDEVRQLYAMNTCCK